MPNMHTGMRGESAINPALERRDRRLPMRVKQMSLALAVTGAKARHRHRYSPDR